eukprot:3941512-Rhodomonas_salina.5
MSGTDLGYAATQAATELCCHPLVRRVHLTGSQFVQGTRFPGLDFALPTRVVCDVRYCHSGWLRYGLVLAPGTGIAYRATRALL